MKNTDRVTTPGFARRQVRYQAVMALYNEGHSQSEIRRRLNLSRKTIRRHLRSDGCPHSVHRVCRNILDPYKPYLRERWSSGCRNAAVLLREIRAMGYPGGRSIMSAGIAKTLRPASSTRANMPKRPLPWASRRAA